MPALLVLHPVDPVFRVHGGIEGLHGKAVVAAAKHRLLRPADLFLSELIQFLKPQKADVAPGHFDGFQLARIILFALAFIAILVAWWVMSHALDLAFHLPVLNTLNRLGGLVLGFGEGVALCFILCWLLRDSYITAEMIDGSFLLPYLCVDNPLMNLPFLNS